MKVACIGDVHGSTNFLDAYMDIKSNHPDIEKIFVYGDWFDPYEQKDIDLMIQQYNEAWDIIKNDDRCVCLIGNHDISGYIIKDGGTNRTYRGEASIKIHDAILPHLEDSYLVYRIGNYLFSHAGVSQTWYEDIFLKELPNTDLFKKGWTAKELLPICGFYDNDWSGYGDSVYQGPTWIRPGALHKDMLDGYNQVVGHTRIKEITNVKGLGGETLMKYDLWIVDNSQGKDYLILDV